jgi:hypothetical protein
MRGDLEPHTAPLGTITLARNVRFATGASVQSRRGQAVLSTGSSAAVSYQDVLDTTKGPDFLHPIADGFVFGASGYGFRYSATKGTCVAGSYSVAQPRGVLETIAREELTPTDAGHRFPWPLSCAVSNGLIAICHASGNGQTVTAAGALAGLQRDPINLAATAGAVVRVMTEKGAVLTTGYWDDMQTAMVVTDPVTGSIYIFYQNGTDVRMRAIDSSGQVGASGSIGTLSAATNFYAACSWPGIGIALVYQSAVNSLTVRKLVAGASVASAPIAITGGAGAPVSCYADATNLYVGWALRGGASYDAQAEAFNTALADTSGGVVTFYALGAATPTLGPPLFGSSVAAGSALALVAASGNTRPFKFVAIGGGLTTGTDQLQTVPLSAPFANGLWWARTLTTYQSGTAKNSQRNVLMDFQESRSATAPAASRLKYAKVALVCDAWVDSPLLAGITTPENVYFQHMHTPAQLSSGEWVMGVPRVVRKERQRAALGGLDCGYLVLCEWLKFAVGVDQQVRTVRDDVIVSGNPAVVSYANGTYQYTSAGLNSMPQSFGLDVGLVQAPGIRAGTYGAVPGDLVSGSTYLYRAVIELIDSRGRRHKSAPSNYYSVTIGVGDSAASITVDFNAPMLRVFNDYPSNSRVVVHIYRSTAGGANFQRCTPAQGAPVVYTTGSAGWADQLSDAYLSEREFLYTDGGITGNDHPPSCCFVAVTEDRIWLAGLWDTHIAQSSKVIVPGEPIQFSDSDAFKVDIQDGSITGIASQDGAVIFFTASSIHVLQGLGPTDQGQGAWDQPRCITRSTGCVDWRSIVETSIGVFYQSERGIMLLPRGAGEPQFIGWPMEDLLESFGSTITGSALCQTSDGSTVRFCTSGGTLIFDLEANAWSYDTPPASPASMVHTKVCDTDFGPTYARQTIVSNYESFDQEHTALTGDNNGSTPIASYLEWAPVHPTGLAGWNEFAGAITTFGKLDGSDYPNGSLTVSCNVDNSTAQVATKSSMNDMSDVDYRMISPQNPRQGCSVTLSIATSAAPWRFIGWTLRLDDLSGTRNQPTVEVY